jgi:hypothetical protein
MNYEGLRDWLARVDEVGELRKVDGVDWNLEMGAIVDVLYREHHLMRLRCCSTRLEITPKVFARYSATSPHRSASR